MKSVCVFCGSNPGKNPAYAEAAREMGALLASQGRTLVFGGGKVGIMGEIADAALELGGKVIGVIPDFLMAREVGHREVTEMIVTTSMHIRKQHMADVSDGFMVLPGGIGTLDEFCEILTWRQLGLHRKPVGFLNTAGYWDPMLAFFRHMVEEGFFGEMQFSHVLVSDDPATLLQLMDDFSIPPSAHPLRPDQV